MFLPDLISAQISWWFALFLWGLRCVCDLWQVLPAESGSSEGGGPQGSDVFIQVPTFWWLESDPVQTVIGMGWWRCQIVLVDGYAPNVCTKFTASFGDVSSHHKERRSSKLSRHPLSCISRSGTMHLNGLGVSELVFDFWCIKDDKVLKFKWCYNMYDLYIYIYNYII